MIFNDLVGKCGHLVVSHGKNCSNEESLVSQLRHLDSQLQL